MNAFEEDAEEGDAKYDEEAKGREHGPEYGDNALADDFELGAEQGDDLLTQDDVLPSQDVALSQAPNQLSDEFKAQIINGQPRTAQTSFAFPPFRQEEREEVDIMAQTPEVVVKLGRRAHDPVHEVYVQQFSEKHCLNLPKPKKLEVVGVDNTALRTWMKGLHVRPRGRVFVLSGSPFVACAFAHAYKTWVSFWVAERVALCQGVRPQGTHPILAYFGSLCGLTGLDEASIADFGELEPSQQAIQVQALQSNLNVQVLIVLNVETADFPLLAALAAQAGIQVVATACGGSLELDVDEVELPPRDANANKQALEAFCYCAINGCQHAERPRCVKQMRNVFFLLNDEHFIAVPAVLEAAERAEIIRDHDVPVAPNTVERVLEVKYLFFHRQAQADLSNLLPVITYDQAQADNWNRFYRGLLCHQSAHQGLPVQAVVRYQRRSRRRREGRAALRGP